MPKKTYGKQTGRAITHELPAPAGGVRLETFVPWTLVKHGFKRQVIISSSFFSQGYSQRGKPRPDRRH